MGSNMTGITFVTPGTMDIRAFTTMGVNAKPRTEKPIGYFGTGLKYAVAVLCRLGATITVHTGGVRYSFDLAPMRFRGSDFDQIVMRRDTFFGAEGWRLGRRQKLPYTTQYGRNWEAWMAFRELYSNTLDEGGECWENEDWNEDYSTELGRIGDQDATMIVVSNCDPFVQAYRDRSSIFVDLSEKDKLAVLPGLEILEGQTQRMFYQGMRAKDLGKPTLHTYNFTHGQELTEDRQLAHEWRIRSVLANTIAAECDDEALIEQIITADDQHWEHNLQPDNWIRPSPAFHAVMMRKPRGVGGGWYGYYGTHDTRPEVAQEDLWRSSGRPWKVDGGDVQAADGLVLFSKPFNMNDLKWAKLAGTLVELANRNDVQYFSRVLEKPERVMVAEDIGCDDPVLPPKVCDIINHKLGGCPSTHEEIRGAFRRVICDESGLEYISLDDAEIPF